MKKIFTFFLCLFLIKATNAQLLYNNGDSLITYLRGNQFGQSGTATTSQVVIFDDVNLPSSSLIGKDSIRITKIQFSTYRLAGAPATTMNLWYSPVEDTSTSVLTKVKIPPTLIGSLALPAQGLSASTYTITLGDSINTFLRMKVDTGKYLVGYQSFFLGASYSDTSGNGIIFGGSTGNAAPNSNTFYIYNPNSTSKLQRVSFNGGYPQGRLWLKLYGAAVNTLPITLSGFSGKWLSTKANLLTWTTATEINNKGFELERSADSKNFSVISFVNSKSENGNSSNSLKYEFTDENALSSTNYYRLKQLDKDGKFTYSEIVAIKGVKLAALEFSAIYPNPVKDNLNIVLSSPKASDVTIVVVDAAGKTVLQQAVHIIEGSNNLPLNVQALKAGNYIIKAICGEGCETTLKKFVKE